MRHERERFSFSNRWIVSVRGKTCIIRVVLRATNKEFNFEPLKAKYAIANQVALESASSSVDLLFGQCFIPLYVK
jgi:hypothetical protein